MDVFLSHSSRDKALVKAISSALPSHFNCWLDEWNLALGQELEASISTALERSTFVIVFLSSNSVESAWVRKELEMALNIEKSTNRTMILPVLLDDCWEQVEPVEFRKRKYLACYSQTDGAVRAFAEQLSVEVSILMADTLSLRSVERQEQKRQASVIDALGSSMGRAVEKGHAKMVHELSQLLSAYPSSTPQVRMLRLQIKMDRLRQDLLAEEEEVKLSQERQRTKEETDHSWMDLVMNGALRADVNGRLEVLRRVEEEIKFWSDNPDAATAEEVLGEIARVAQSYITTPT